MVTLLIAVLAALASAGVFMLRRPPAGSESNRIGPNRQMAWALALRVGLSVALFLLILFSWYMGWIKPTGIPAGR